MAKSRSKNVKAKAAWAEYRFKIDAFSPDTIPMGRLAEYMAELARMLGEKDRVHFRKLNKGSTVLVHRIEREAVPKVQEQISRLKNGQASGDPLRAFQTLNRYLRDDNAVGALQDSKTSAEIIRFPGREEIKEKFGTVRQQASLDGIVTGIRGKDATIHITIQVEGQQVSGCHTTRAIAKRLGASLFEPVRLLGRGRWLRDADGNWNLEDFKVDDFETLSDASLSEAIGELRAIPGDWTEDALSELSVLRHGQERKPHGRH